MPEGLNSLGCSIGLRAFRARPSIAMRRFWWWHFCRTRPRFMLRNNAHGFTLERRETSRLSPNGVRHGRQGQGSQRSLPRHAEIHLLRRKADFESLAEDGEG